LPTTTGPANNPVAGAPTDYDVTLVVLDYSLHEVNASQGRILVTDKKVLLAKGNLAVDPLPAHKLIIGGKAHSLELIQPLAPGGTVVLWTIQARK
jgi:hypothetical protein